jgi:bifunctional ADP-heptose synthase (sugar kinase/adenylyltransferase)
VVGGGAAVNLVEQLLSRIREKQRTIIVIGDAMVDRWVHGRMLQCQDGYPKFVQEEVIEVPGGAANAERCLMEWGIETSLYSYAQPNCAIKCRYVEKDRIVFRADDDKLPTHQETPLQKWKLEQVYGVIEYAGGVLLSDYNKGVLTPEYICKIVDLCKKCGIPCVADCKREPGMYVGCILKGNAEWCSRTKVNLLTKNMVITYGYDAPTVSGKSIELFNLPPVICTNHVGAGDCFAVHLTLALAYGFSLKEAAALAHSAGRVYVQSPHNRPPMPAEIAADLSSFSAPTLS